MSDGFELDFQVERAPHDGSRFRLRAVLGGEAGVTVVFGPSGAGKSTLLLAVLGALRGVRGRITVAGRTLLDSDRGIELPVRRRNLGIVFQDALLFPHLDALHNVAFGARGSRGERRRTALEALERVGAAQLARRRPRQLSGGERQRVALARALAPGPAALLLDEPFSALDRPSREALVEVLIELQRSTGIPFLHVTHDAGEAVRLGTSMALLDDGRFVQVGAPAEVLAAPGSIEAARVVGTENLFRAVVTGHAPADGYSHLDLGGTSVETGLLQLAPGSEVAMGLRAEDVLLAGEPISGTSARNVLAGEVLEVRDGGDAVEVRVATPVPFRVRVTPAAARELRLRAGARVYLLIKAHAFKHLV